MSFDSREAAICGYCDSPINADEMLPDRLVHVVLSSSRRACRVENMEREPAREFLDPSSI